MRRVLSLVAVTLVAAVGLAADTDKAAGPGSVAPVKAWELLSPKAVVSEGFETAVPPAGWLLHSTSSFTWSQDDYAPHSGTYDAHVEYDETLAQQDEVLYSSPVTASSILRLAFWSYGSVLWCRDTYDNCDLRVYVDTDTTWGNGNETLVYTADDDWPDTWTWGQSMVNLDAYATGSPVYIAFNYYGSDGAEIALDDIEVFIDEEPPAPPTPTDCTICAGDQFVSTDVPVSTVDNATVTSSLTLTGGATVSDLSVCMTVSHTWPDDLDISLESPLGTTVELTTDNGYSYDLVSALLCFHPNGAEPIINYDSDAIPSSGCYIPEGDLTAFDGEAADGTWTLYVGDDAGGDSGALEGWSICLGTSPAAEEADLALTKTSDAGASVTPGSTVVYTFTLTNNGPGDETNAIISDTLPDGVTYVSDTCSGTYTPATREWTCPMGAMPNGHQVTCDVTVTVDADASGAIVNSASVVGEGTDTNGDNDTASTPITVAQQAPGIPATTLVGGALLALLLALGGALALRRLA